MTEKFLEELNEDGMTQEDLDYRDHVLHPCDGCGAYADCDRCEHQKVPRPALPVYVDPCDDCGGEDCDKCGKYRRA